ncbi:hypothetical protein [[Clostridium] scindens]|uniref:hypothetical protein n=1 Tax=Clostridium scindens (strain JCM 10418 / VPI 12708) TaxID=29347 RepID=UPI003992A4FC
MSYIDLSGMHFGFLVAQEYAGRGYWKCKCLNCGKDKVVKGEHLRLGYKICGCLKELGDTRDEGYNSLSVLIKARKST